MSDFPPNLSIRPLTIEDLDQVVALEAKGFSSEERCSPEKLTYRLNMCPELCSGLFIREFTPRYRAINLPDENNQAAATNDDDSDDEQVALPVKSSVVKETLIGHIIATRIQGPTITNASMEVFSPDVPGSGHVESSPIIGVHSVVIDPEWQGKSLGTLLLHDYIQKLSNQDLGDQVVIISHEGLVPFYEKIGFTNHGKSDCKYAGEDWFDLSIRLIPTDDI